MQLSPLFAAQLAKDVYDVQNAYQIEDFFDRPLFSSKSGDTKHLKAEVGSYLVNTKDGFGICAIGGKGYENDIFLIFRGSTFANNNADWVSNAHIGIEFSRTGLPVHIGFNQIFGSMLPKIKEFLGLHTKITGTIIALAIALVVLLQP